MIWERFLEVSQMHGEAIAVITDNETLTYAQFIERVRIEAGKLSHAGDYDEKPARVLLKPSVPLSDLLRVFACWSVNFVPVMLRDGQSNDKNRHISKLARPVATFPDEMTAGQSPVAQASRPFKPHDEALVICTSGTTGTPKLVALPAESILVTARTIASDFEFRTGDVLAVCTPLSYMYGLMGIAVSGLLSGAAVRLFGPEVPLTEVQSAIRQEGITVVQGPPSLLSLFLAYWSGDPFDTVRLVTTGGEYLEPGVVDRLAEAFPQGDFRLIYGMTEAGPRISHTRDIVRYGAGILVGRPFEHIDWRIEPVPDEDLPEGAGLLSLKGPNVFLGYIEPGNTYSGVSDEGYFTSTDLVCEHPDKQLCLLGRYDRLFKTGGKLINPQEIEDFMMRRPDVRCALCWPEKHPLLGFAPVVEVVLEDGSKSNSRDLMEYCSSLASHETPRRIEIRSTLENAASGKRVVRASQTA